MKKRNVGKISIDLKKEKEVRSIKEIKKREWFKLFLILAGIVIVFIIFFGKMDKKREYNYNLIKSNLGVAKGVIIKKFVYKGRTISLNFKVGNTIYIGSDALDKGRDKNVGDSLLIKYYVKNPNIFITDVNDKFYFD